MNTGGYQIINLENRPLTLEVGMVYEGIYDKIERTTKAILLTGLNVGGVEKRDEFCTVTIDQSNFILHTQSYDITINDNDVVVCNSVSSGGGLSVITYDFTSESEIDLGIDNQQFGEIVKNNIIMIDKGLAGLTIMTGLYIGAGVELRGINYSGSAVVVKQEMDSTVLAFVE